MSVAVVKIQGTTQHQKTVEQWLREDVVKAYDESVADPSIGEPLDAVFDRMLAQFEE